jgi:hypothetical protein
MKNKFSIFLEICIFISCLIVIKNMYDLKKTYENFADKQCPTDIAYYKCGGSKKDPKWCPIEIYED